MPRKHKEIAPSKKKGKRVAAPPPVPLVPMTEARKESRAEDLRLIHTAIAGDQGAFKRLMKKYHASLYNLIYRLIRNKDEVEDLTQEAFVKAFQSLKYFNEQYAFSTWLYKIASNNTIDYIRKKKLETFSIDKPIASEDGDYRFELPDLNNQPDGEMMMHQRAAMLNDAIAKLPEKYRKVIMMRHAEERDYAEIAKMLKLPIGTVKAHIFRAREMLYKSLREKIKQF
jgi:RNA polymerase sigma-70 factor (ECF subfamily)